ncbi:MAG: CoA-binding protein [Anaerolineae bacterium]|nr:CoA-binding protein [Anaerolineae bacterium]MCO5191694.1 CoA-binding protein [Anaerolineae bacterium]
MLNSADPVVIERILERTKTIAVVGFSSNVYKAGYYVSEYMQQQGYRIIPVNPNLTKGLGETAYPSLQAIPEPVDLVLIFRRPAAVPPFVDAAIEIGAPVVWMQLGIVHEDSAEKAHAAGLDVVMDRCILVEHRRRAAYSA